MRNFLYSRAALPATVACVAALQSARAQSGQLAAPSSCLASASSLTPAEFTRVLPETRRPSGGLTLVSEQPLPGPANRFDYQSFDSTTSRLYMNHMNAGETLVLDTRSSTIVGRITGVSRATGVLAVPATHRIFISAAGAHEVATVDDRTLTVTHHTAGISFPDGIAYVPELGRIFVSDEDGRADAVIDANAGMLRSMIPLGGEAGNTHYDPVSHCVLVADQTNNELVAIDPGSEKVVRRYPLPGAEHPHGFAMDSPGRLLFMSCEGNAKLLVIDMTTMKVISTHAVGAVPDVLAWDSAWRRLYVASEGGVLSAFWADGVHVRPVGEYRAPHAHTVGLDTRTHRIYVPLQDVDGHPVLRVLAPVM